jgi:hypothetical protein
MGVRGASFVIFIIPLWAATQIVCALGPGLSSYKPSEDQRPTADALKAAKNVSAGVRTICGDHCPQFALLRNSTAPNIFLSLNGSDAKLVYSPQFFSTAYSAFGDEGILALMAHEVGHGLDDTMGAQWIKSSWDPETRADGWAGCVIARLSFRGAALQSALDALAKYAPTEVAGSQPSAKRAQATWSVRLNALRTGYTQCGGDGSQFDKTQFDKKR